MSEPHIRMSHMTRLSDLDMVYGINGTEALTHWDDYDEADRQDMEERFGVGTAAERIVRVWLESLPYEEKVALTFFLLGEDFRTIALREEERTGQSVHHTTVMRRAKRALSKGVTYFSGESTPPWMVTMLGHLVNADSELTSPNVSARRSLDEVWDRLKGEAVGSGD